MSKTQWKLRKGATWRGKLEEDHPNHGKILPVPPRMRKSLGTGTMVIPRPLDVDSIMRSVKRGRLMTQSQLRERLARKSGADHACPLTTGIFVRIVAEAAEENSRTGKKRITPYWRTIKDDGSLNERLPGGVNAQAAKLRAEGFTCQPATRGRRIKVKGFESALVR
jgi:alkylated DNA nucleotide flippase Atl1